jgi:hypothetical protein
MIAPNGPSEERFSTRAPGAVPSSLVEEAGTGEQASGVPGEPGAETKDRAGKRKREAETAPEERKTKEQRTASQASAQTEPEQASGEQLDLYLSPFTPEPESPKQEPLSASQPLQMAPAQGIPEILAQEPPRWYSLDL